MNAVVVFGVIFGLVHGAAGVQTVPGLPYTCYNEDGDLNLAFMVKVSGKGSDVLCTGELYSAARVKYVEALVYSIRKINRRQDLLPNVTLGFVIMDTCGRDLACLARATYLIPDPKGQKTEVTAGNGQCIPEPQRYNVIGVVGPSTSREAVLLSSLMSIFKIPVVADFSTSDELSDKSRFEYYLRLVPPDRFQAKAMIDLLLYFNWSYAFLLYSEGSYGENAGKLTIADAKKKGVCFAVAQVVSSEISVAGVEELMTMLVENGKARALILFLEPFHLDMVINAINKLGYRGYFMIIGGDTMSDTNYGPPADGAMVIHFTGRRVPEFEDYYLELTPQNNPNNPWMDDLWEALYGCSWTDSSDRPSCEDVQDVPFPDQDVGEKVSTVMDGPKVFALGIQDLINTKCPNAYNDKTLLKQCVTGEALLPYLRNVSFEGYSTDIKFDPQGDMIGSYSIRQYLAGAPKVFVEVAVWQQKTDSINVFNKKINWGIYNKTTPTSIPESLCSYPCKAKEYKVRRDLSCCWDCKTCRLNEILVDNFTSCEVCPLNEWPDVATQTFCEDIAPTYILWTDSMAAGLLIASCLGLFLSIGTIVLFIVHRNNRLIKASSRELSAIILTGIFLAYATIFFYVAKPDPIMCAINRYGFSVTITFIYAPLLVKTNRIFRIFAAGKKGTKKPSFIDSQSQVFICCILLLIQVSSYQDIKCKSN